MNDLRLRYLSLAGVFIFFQPVQAVTVVQCEDEQGSITFQDRCAPGTKEVGSKDYNTRGGGRNQAVFTGPVTLYRIAECDGCDEIKEFMGVRNIQVTEKDVNENTEYQNELKERTGTLKVPTVIIGDQAIVGYDRDKLLAGLNSAGATVPVADEDNPGSAE